MRGGLIILFSGLFVLPLKAAPFINLGFDGADISSIQLWGKDFGSGRAQDLLPGWTLFYDSVEVQTLNFNTDNLGRTSSVLFDAARPEVQQYYGEGKYLLFLRDTPNLGRFALVQHGLIPRGSAILSYRGGGSMPFEVYINGEQITNLPRELVSGRSGYMYYEIGKFAGQEVELKFIPMTGSLWDGGITVIDSVGFAVPEPGTSVLLALGGFLSCVFARRKLGRRPK